MSFTRGDNNRNAYADAMIAEREKGREDERIHDNGT